MNWQLIDPDAKIIQVEPDPLEIGRQYAVTIGIHADTGKFLEDLLELAQMKGNSPGSTNRDKVIADIASRKDAEKARYYDADLASVPIKPQLITQVLEEVAPRDAIYVVGSGHHTHFANYVQVSSRASISGASAPAPWPGRLPPRSASSSRGRIARSSCRSATATSA